MTYSLCWFGIKHLPHAAGTEKSVTNQRKNTNGKLTGTSDRTTKTPKHIHIIDKNLWIRNLSVPRDIKHLAGSTIQAVMPF